MERVAGNCGFFGLHSHTYYKTSKKRINTCEKVGNWQHNHVFVGKIFTPLAKMLLKRMKARGKSILSSPVFAAIYLDPEYQVLLSEEQKI